MAIFFLNLSKRRSTKSKHKKHVAHQGTLESNCIKLVIKRKILKEQEGNKQKDKEEQI